MPRLTIPSILSQCETWVASNPCPKNADGEPRIAHWSTVPPVPLGCGDCRRKRRTL
jgi:hypothetical protein